MPNPFQIPGRLANMVLLHGSRLRDRFFPLRQLPQPDLTHAQVITVMAEIYHLGEFGDEIQAGERRMGFLPDYPPQVASKQGWAKTVDEYALLANSTFALQYPNHPFSIAFRARLPNVTDEELRALVKGE